MHDVTAHTHTMPHMYHPLSHMTKDCTLSVCISTIAEECSVGTTGNTVTRCPPIPNLTDTCGWANGRGVSLTGGGGEPERGGGGTVIKQHDDTIHTATLINLHYVH